MYGLYMEKGSFRCDAYLKWLYEKTTNGSLGGMTPNSSYNSSLLTLLEPKHSIIN